LTERAEGTRDALQNTQGNWASGEGRESAVMPRANRGTKCHSIRENGLESGFLIYVIKRGKKGGTTGGGEEDRVEK